MIYSGRWPNALGCVLELVCLRKNTDDQRGWAARGGRSAHQNRTLPPPDVLNTAFALLVCAGTPRRCSLLGRRVLGSRRPRVDDHDAKETVIVYRRSVAVILAPLSLRDSPPDLVVQGLRDEYGRLF